MVHYPVVEAMGFRCASDIDVPAPPSPPPSYWQSSIPEEQDMESELLTQMVEMININQYSIHSASVRSAMERSY